MMTLRHPLLRCLAPRLGIGPLLAAVGCASPSRAGSSPRCAPIDGTAVVDRVRAASVRTPSDRRFACHWSGENRSPRRTFHVSPGGNDDNDGLSEGRAFRTLQHAADMAGPGDTVLVHAGVYSGRPGGEAVLNVARSGSEWAPVTFRAAPGERPIIRSNDWSAIRIADASYIVIDGFELVGRNADLTREYAMDHKTDRTNPATNSQGVQIWNYKTGGHSHHVIVENNRIHDFGGNGITGSECDCITVANNVLYANGFYSVWNGSGVLFWQPRPLVDSDGYKFVIRDNRVFDTWNYVPYIDGGAITEPLTGGAIMLDMFTRHGHGGPLLVEGNVVFRNQGCGIETYETVDADVVNNTLYQNMLGASVDWGEFCDFRSHGTRVVNNIFVASPGHRATFVRATIPDATFRHNLYWPPSAGMDASGTSDRSGDPHFVSTATSSDGDRVTDVGWDFHLRADSPALGMGDPSLASKFDADGAPRNTGHGVDVGAYAGR